MDWVGVENVSKLQHVAQVNLSHLRLLILDEADKVLEAGKGFMEQVDVVFAACSKSASLSTSLFSATLPDWVEQIASSVLQSPTSIVVGAKNVSSLDVDQSLLFVGQVCCAPQRAYHCRAFP